MKITIKTLQQKVFQIDVEGSDTVGDLKSKIQDTQGHVVSSQKIIYSGKILADDKTIESLSIKEKDFLVLMVSKPKVAPPPATSSASSSTTVTAEEPVAAAAPSPAAPAPVVSSPAPPSSVSTPPAAAAPAAPAAATPAFGDMGSFLSGEALQSSIANMTEMGFPKEEVLRAMRASYNNPDRAVEYLMNVRAPRLHVSDFWTLNDFWYYRAFLRTCWLKRKVQRRLLVLLHSRQQAPAPPLPLLRRRPKYPSLLLRPLLSRHHSHRTCFSLLSNSNSNSNNISNISNRRLYPVVPGHPQSIWLRYAKLLKSDSYEN
jgi:hypothetical protein